MSEHPTTETGMSEDAILGLFRHHHALLEGHFILSSGLHSDRYIQCALVLQHPGAAEQLGRELAARLHDKLAASVGAGSGNITAVVAPALGGVLVAHEVARALGVRALFTERQDGRMTLRRGFALEPNEHVLVVEDVITTGGSTRETITAVEEAGGKVVAAGSLVDRSGGSADLGLPRAALLTLRVQNYDPAQCPLCRAGIAPSKPGSRKR
jgi:orotate phosphoribosyltransferase